MSGDRTAKLQAPRGTFDVLPADEFARHDLVERIARERFALARYERIETPVFEDTAVFARGIGDATEIVQKEMYTFRDQGDRSVTLRPEGTAPICRAYVEHGMHKLPQPVRLWYSGPFFRQEAPQAGRFRQFFQVGCEALGSDDPALDAESIALLAGLLRDAGVAESRLRLSSLGSAPARAAYREQLADYLREHRDRLSAEVLARIDLNPLRAFDTKDPATQAVMEGAPHLLDQIDPADAEHFADVRALLDTAGIAYEIDPTLVRGLDYYSRTVFEFSSDRLGAQSGLGGGGRYDALVELLGGPPTPAVGWAAGIERIVLAAGSTEADRARRHDGVFIAVDPAGASPRPVAFDMLCRLRARGVPAEMELAGRSLKGQRRHAERSGAAHMITVSACAPSPAAGAHVTLRDLRTGAEAVAPVDDAVNQMVARMGRSTTG